MSADAGLPEPAYDGQWEWDVTEHRAEPTGVTAVVDDDGDDWIRNSDGLWHLPDDRQNIEPREWADLLRDWGPLSTPAKDGPR